jgi:proline iminopeptidase
MSVFEKTLEKILFPAIQPYTEGYLKVSEIHQLWYAQYGNPAGIPVVVIHGGPGFGCSAYDMRYFDPAYFRIILFDQRGAKRSKPFGETAENSTPHLIKDIELLRVHLDIKRWFVFGGSWGSALAILYGEAHPSSCLGFVLRGIFLGRQHENEQVWYGMKDTFPEAWDEL